LYQTLENKQKLISQVMTSKSPVRRADDIDEAVLTYAEIKALATGNPLIKEKMELDIALQRLTLMESAWKSERWSLEGAIAQLPGKINYAAALAELIVADITNLKPAPSFSMMVQGKHYTDENQAGFAILEHIKNAASPRPEIIGEYRGMKLEIGRDDGGKLWVMTLIGKARYSTELGDSARGNIMRLDNLIERMPKQAEAQRSKALSAERQLENVKAELEKPFAYADELTEKRTRLRELETELQLRENVSEDGVAAEPEEYDTPEPDGKMPERSDELCR
jgi:hypothetical protein